MRVAKALRFLSLPAALGLGTALVIACSDEGPTAPGQTVSPAEVATPFAAPKKGHSGGGSTDNLFFGENTCPDGYNWNSGVGSDVDLNGDGIICTKKPTKKA